MANKNNCKGRLMRNDVFNFVKNYIAEHGYAPSYNEIGEGVYLASRSSVKTYIDELIEEGRLETDIPKGRPMIRAIRVARKEYENAE